MRKSIIYGVLQYLQSAPQDLGWQKAIDDLEYLLSLEN